MSAPADYAPLYKHLCALVRAIKTAPRIDLPEGTPGAEVRRAASLVVKPSNSSAKIMDEIAEKEKAKKKT